MGIQDKFLVLGKYGCLLLCYVKALGVEPETVLKDFDNLVKEKIIDNECFVLNADKLLKFYKPETDLWVCKCSMNEAKGEYIVVKYNYKTFYHWVLYKRNADGVYNFFWNSMDKSSCVENGIPDKSSVRDISNKKAKLNF